MFINSKLFVSKVKRKGHVNKFLVNILCSLSLFKNVAGRLNYNCVYNVTASTEQVYRPCRLR